MSNPIHCFVLASNTFGGHEMMATKIIREVADNLGPARIIGTQTQIDFLRERLPIGIDYVLLQHKERRFESFLGYLNPYFLGALRELRKAIRGAASMTIVNGGLTANHTLTLAAGRAARYESVLSAVYFPMLHDASELSLGKLRAISFRLARRRVASAFNFFITIDGVWRDRLLVAEGRSLDVRVIHNLLEIKAKPIAPTPELGLAVRLCFIGRFDRYQKGLDLLIDTLRFLRYKPPLASMHWVFVGRGPYESMLRKACDELACDSLSFEFHDWQLSAIDLMASCHALVLPSRLEGVPTVVAEALILGLPVFAYAIDGVDLMVSRDMLIKPFDTKAMANALAQFANEVSAHLVLPKASTYLDMLRDKNRFHNEVIGVYGSDFAPQDKLF